MFSRYVISQAKHNSYFIVGMVLGLWVALAVIPMDEEPAPCETSSVTMAPTSDEFEPQREEKLLGPAGQTAGRSVQRPRYYSTELGMRGSLLTGVLSSEDALKLQVAALNRTAARLQPALKFFITASAMSSVPGLANVVGFTDTREMLKPFHALKYLADNFLEEYDFFFLVSDKAFVNARRLMELVSQLSISQDVYMGTIAENESQYCSLDSGIILSNSVLRAIHNELDWCVRNSYSPHHHENIGRCVLHSAHLACTSDLQAETYKSLLMEGEAVSSALTPGLADAVTVHPLALPMHFHQLHAYVSRVFLERDYEEVLKLRGYLWRNSARHPEGYRNSTWPGGLRGDPGMESPLPDTRFDHLRWTTFNATHAFMPDDHRMIGPVTGADREAIDLVMSTVRVWALRRWPRAEEVRLVEGAWRWEPARALRYRLLLRLAGNDAHTRIRMVEVVRPLGAARLVPVRYVTESGRVSLVLPLPALRPHLLTDALTVFLRSYDAVCLGQDKNTNLIVVLIHPSTENTTSATEIRDNVASLLTRHNGSKIDVVDVTLDVTPIETEDEVLQKAAKVAIAAALDKLQRDSLILLAVPHMEFNQDFLNRVRMNTIAGSQWYLPLPFARHSQYDHPRFVTPNGGKPQQHTGRFNRHHSPVLAFYRADYDSALAEFRGSSSASIASMLAHSPLRCIRAPEPGLVLAPRPNSCSGTDRPECLQKLKEDNFETLDLGAKHSLAMLMLEMQAELD